MVDNYILTQIKKWLRHEVKYNQEIADAKDNNQTEVCSDGTDDISYGRPVWALGLLNQIKKREKETADTPQKEWIRGHKKWRKQREQTK